MRQTWPKGILLKKCEISKNRRPYSRVSMGVVSPSYHMAFCRASICFFHFRISYPFERVDITHSEYYTNEYNTL